jgi:uncharacterized protein YhaN
MRIKRLELKAFGPFTARTLDFDSPLPGLHVVHGPNEAGKSSAMRALQALLFGFPVRTGDNFLHPYDQLLVGGCLQQPDGAELHFQRRKKAKNDLFDDQDRLLPPDALAPYLQGMGLDLFTSIHGIDHETLVQGGQGILDQHGEVGQALFAAGSGFASLKSVLDSLETEADELFRPRASSKAISQSLAAYKELQAELRAVSLGSQEWQRHCQALAEAEAELEALKARRLELDRRANQLERLRRALPFLGQRHLMLEKLQAMGEVLHLPEGFGLRRRQLEEGRRIARVRLEGAEERLAELRDRQVGMRPDQAVLDHGEAIEDLHQRLGEYRKALKDRPGLEGMRVAHKTEAAHLLRRIRPDLNVEQAEALRPGLAKRQTVQALGRRHEAVLQEVRLAEGRLRDACRDLHDRRAELDGAGATVAPDSLVRALQDVRKAGDLDEELRSRQTELKRQRGNCRAALERLGLWAGPLEDVAGHCLPGPETVHEHEAALSLADEEIRRLAQEEDRVGQELAALARDLRAIEHAAEVPSEGELAACRDRREEGWNLLRRRWVDGEDVEGESRLYAPDKPLHEAYEQNVALVDRTADRMYREADRVQKHAQLLAGAEAAEAALKGLRDRAEAARQSRGGLLARWRGLWAGCAIEPLGPREMRAWLSGFEALRLQVEELGRVEADVRAKEARREESRVLLARELELLGRPVPADDAGLGPVLRLAEAAADALREGAAWREALSRSVRELEAALRKAEAEAEAARLNRDEWRAGWSEVLAFLGLPGDVSPAEAADYVETAQECLAKIDAEEVLRKRLGGIDRDLRAFERSVGEVAALVDPSGAGPDAALTVARLKGLLAQALRVQAISVRHEEEKAALEKSVMALREELRLLDEGMAALRVQARCADDAGMEEAERRFADWSALRRSLDEVESALAGIAEGGILEDLEVLAREEDADALPGKVAALRAELEERVEPRIGALSELVGQEKNELARMNGGDAAARIAEEMQEVLAALSRMTDRFIRLKVASSVLRAEIERYRAANQDPLLGIASGFFRELTLGSFAGLRADMDESDRPVLVGLRPDGGWVPVAGMSSGTRDQLYLSLRLASLERRAQTVEPMPFIVDDILINFDEMRCQATLGALAGMADRIQVILFTHQAQIAAMARSLERQDRVFVHSL